MKKMSEQNTKPAYYIGYLFDIEHSRHTSGTCRFQFDCVDPQRRHVGILEFDFPVDRISEGEAEVFLQRLPPSVQFDTYRVEGGEHYRLLVTMAGVPAKLHRGAITVNVVLKDPEDEDYTLVDWAEDNLGWPLAFNGPSQEPPL